MSKERPFLMPDMQFVPRATQHYADQALISELILALQRISAIPVHECDDARNAGGLTVAKAEAASALARVPA